MYKRKSFWTGIFAVAAMSVLILDSKTVLSGAQEGIILCIRSVIPALFPFFVLSSLLCDAISGKKVAFLRPIGKLCGAPAGCESLFAVGLLGGYPVGAKLISESYRTGKLCKHAAQRMLGFCCQAGPSFIFGLVSMHFSSVYIALMIWSIQIVSSLLVGISLPQRNMICASRTGVSTGKDATIKGSVQAISLVCGWVILFRCVLAVMNKWLLQFLPNTVRILIFGSLELTNGCCMLTEIQDENIRFVICCTLLSFGGVCVLMQTAGVTEGIGLGMYLPGKLLQTCAAFPLSCLVQFFLFPNGKTIPVWLPLLACIVYMILCLKLRRKNSSILKSAVV